jgi:hypothetical protein
VAIVIKSLGPKLVMLKEMLRDLFFFVIIIVIFICSYGVITQANLHPDENILSWDLLRFIVNKGYWPIFGQISILDDDLNFESFVPANGRNWYGFIFRYLNFDFETHVLQVFL